ncbi:cytochrome b6-f complex iron-sulfur subunit [Synechococcus sp. CBW1004]|uniref:cytochrome b6-f complex iron-sulfur subunit n=1 Tax=Synechococcus sp. CBW1004 TaxID=1353136 RepID=UPI0018CDFC5F|nr:cytochrome b6-f complex iron-sulfur subunit [Synechococcus sp. CBW1004]QPN64125.1 cytochrome b6-f complex iron-sulfur subunit [Synechococcus sp. CBW1004]
MTNTDALGRENEDQAPDPARRQLLNLITFGAVTGVVGGVLYPALRFFLPPRARGGAAGVLARDELGNPISASGWLRAHKPGERSLVQGLKGDPTYLIVTGDDAIGSYGINAICTHLGCVVPWNAAAGKFICPCHGSQYDEAGQVVRGPAPLSLALAHVQVDNDQVLVSPWNETDFRDGSRPWWA